jgi:4-hydroxy-tetrahydrodipicolinate synthase
MADLPSRNCLITAVATPLTADLAPDATLLTAHCRSLLASGCDGIALFGTTGEGPHFSVAERQRTLEQAIAGGIDAGRLVVSASASSLADVVALARHAIAWGAGPILLMPPWFLRGATATAGVERFYGAAIERIAEPGLRILLYHFPDITGFGFDPALARRLVDRHPGIITGIKDSGGNWDKTAALLREFPHLTVLTGTETHLPQAIAAGAAGTICGLGNMMPGLLRRLIDRPELAARLLPAIQAIDDLVSAGPFVPGVKAVVAALTGQAAWRQVTPPLAPLSEPAAAALGEQCKRLIAAADLIA